MRISLRKRLYIWYAIGVPVLIVGLTFVAQQVMIDSLRSAIDDRLREHSEVIARAIIDNPGNDTEHYEILIEQLTERRLPFVPAVIRVSDSERNVLATFGDIPETMMPIMDRQLLLPELPEGRTETIDIRAQDALRLHTVVVRDPSSLKTIALVQTGDSLVSVVTAQTQLWRYALPIAVGAGLLALLIGLFIVHWGLNPLDVIMKQVREIGQSTDLKKRIPKESRAPELQELADSVNGMLQKLETSFKAREVFFAGVSHDLKTPLTVLQGEIDVMQMNPNADAETKKVIERMSREVRRLVGMTNNVLLSAQLESSSLPVLTEVNIREVLEDVERDTIAMADDLDFKVSAAIDLIVLGDYDMLRQMLLNIVDNAIKFTPKGGTVDLSLTHDEEHAVLRVVDLGPGISKEHLARVTESFYKADVGPGSRGTGVGLGLAIVKNIVELHQGQLSIESQEGNGTTVTICLPLSSRPR